MQPFSEIFNAIRKSLTSKEITQHVNTIYKSLAWFIIDYFTHNIDVISKARKNFRPQNTNDETVLAEHSDYVWDPEWSQLLFVNIPTDISSQAISTISLHNDDVEIYPLTVDATPLSYNSFLPERVGNNSLNSTFIQQKHLNGARGLTQQDI